MDGNAKASQKNSACQRKQNQSLCFSEVYNPFFPTNSFIFSNNRNLFTSLRLHFDFTSTKGTRHRNFRYASYLFLSFACLSPSSRSPRRLRFHELVGASFSSYSFFRLYNINYVFSLNDINHANHTHHEALTPRCLVSSKRSLHSPIKGSSDYRRTRIHLVLYPRHMPKNPRRRLRTKVLSPR